MSSRLAPTSVRDDHVVPAGLLLGQTVHTFHVQIG